MNFKIPPIYALWLLIAVTLIIFVGISFSNDLNVGSYTIKKGKFPETLLASNDISPNPPELELDSLPEILEEKIIHGPDTTIHNVLIFGDSMTHYLAMSIAKYGTRNNYKVTSVTWVSSSIKAWSQTDKIRKYMDMVKPDFVIITLGANDLNIKNYDTKIPEINRIVQQLDNIPYIWVGPPLWKHDKGLYAMLEKTIPQGHVFHIDEDFELPRARDHIHPTHKGAQLWADTLMRWMKISDLPLMAEFPDSIDTHQDHKFIYLQSNQ